MHGSGVSNLRRILAGAMSAVMLVAVLFSALYVVAEADHDCAGDDCPICICLHQCENTLHQIGGRFDGTVAAVAPAALLVLAVFPILCAYLQATPVSRKVRLNN